MIKALILDLDNTVYPESCGMEQYTVQRMREYSARFLGISIDEAASRRRESLKTYGTTLEWLMGEYGFAGSDDYFSYVHPEGEEDFVPYDPELPSFLDTIALPKYIFTNAPMEHAERVLRKLRIADKFDAVFDVCFCGLKGKPAREAVMKVQNAVGLPAETLLFADDVPRYVEGFIACGGHGVLVDCLDKHPEADVPRIGSIYELPTVIARYAD